MGRYLDLMDRVLSAGSRQEDRTGSGTLSVFGAQMCCDLAQGLSGADHQEAASPLDHGRAAVVPAWRHEGARAAGAPGRHWDERANGQGDLDPVYGKQWRDRVAAEGRHIDRIRELVETIRTNPAGRRQVVTAWNRRELHAMALSPCHCLFRTHVADGRLSLQLYRRSADIVLGAPFFCKVTSPGSARSASVMLHGLTP